MPTVTIRNETHSTLHIAMLTGVPCHFNNDVPPGGEFRQDNVTSVSRRSLRTQVFIPFNGTPFRHLGHTKPVNLKKEMNTLRESPGVVRARWPGAS